jgi:CheY-like chemotaxis protein
MTNDPASARHVLVIEDDPDIQDFIHFLLEDAGYTVTRAEHGAAALTVLRQADRLPDLIVLDLQMPVLDGRAFRRAQQVDPRWRTIPVILMSASTGFDTAAQDLAIATLLRKPFPPDDLLALVAGLCAT